MQLVFDQTRLRQLDHDHGERVDLVLDDGTHLVDVLVHGDEAWGFAVGGHDGARSFAEMPELRGRSVVSTLRLRGLLSAPLAGMWLRRLWAFRVRTTLSGGGR